MKPIGYQLLEPDDAPDEPISLVQAKQQLKMEGFDDDDAYLGLLIQAVREKCEEYCHISLVPQQWQLGFAGWPCGGILELFRPPVATVESIEYYPSGADALTALDAAFFKLDATILPGVLKLKGSLPSVNCDYAAPIQVVINCGTWTPFPARAQLAMLMFLTSAYEIRPSVVTGTIAVEVPDGAKSLLDSLKIWKM